MENERLEQYAKERWDGRPYYSLHAWLKHKFGTKVYKLSLDAGMTCPNRDGTKGWGGCIFCSAGGSGEFAAGSADGNGCGEFADGGFRQAGIARQIAAAKERVAKKCRLADVILPIFSLIQIRTRTFPGCGRFLQKRSCSRAVSAFFYGRICGFCDHLSGTSAAVYGIR